MGGVEKLYFPAGHRKILDPYMPNHDNLPRGRPFITLTYACSLDSQIAVAPGAQTVLSGPASKAMTHYLRTKHDAILVGSGTAITDDPGLNSRLSEAVEQGLDLQPRPVVLDRRARWAVKADSKVIKTFKDGRGKAPFIGVHPAEMKNVPSERVTLLEQCEGTVFPCEGFTDMLVKLHNLGIRSIMVEGGAQIINALIADHSDLLDSVIITYAPVFLGEGGVTVCPVKPAGRASDAVARLQNVTWLPLDADVVMCAKSNQ